MSDTFAKLEAAKRRLNAAIRAHEDAGYERIEAQAAYVRLLQRAEEKAAS